MRAITFRGDIRHGGQRGQASQDAAVDGYYPIIQGPGNTRGNANDHTKNAVISSIQLSEDGGLILKAGGSGTVLNEFQWDIRGTEADGPDEIPGDGGATTSTVATDYHAAMFRRAGETSAPTVGTALTQAQADKLTGWAADNCSGVTFPCWDGNMRDLTIDFGTPSPDPDGESGYHWASKIPSSTGPAQTRRRRRHAPLGQAQGGEVRRPRARKRRIPGRIPGVALELCGPGHRRDGCGSRRFPPLSPIRRLRPVHVHRLSHLERQAGPHAGIPFRLRRLRRRCRDEDHRSRQPDRGHVHGAGPPPWSWSPTATGPRSNA